MFHQYTVRIEASKREALLAHLHDRGIGTGVFYPVPVHKQSFYQSELGYNDHLAEAECAAAEVLSLPVHPRLSEENLATIAKAVNEF